MKNSNKQRRQVRLNLANTKKGKDFNLVLDFDAKVSNEEMGATIVARFLKMYKTFRTFSGKGNRSIGFNFAQKFYLTMVVDSRKLKSKNWENVDVNGEKVDLGLTLVNSEERISTFISKMEVLIMDLFDTATLEVKTFNDVKKLFKEQLN